MKNDWKKIINEFFDKNKNKKGLRTFDIYGSLDPKDAEALKLFYCLAIKKNLKWFQENWRRWQDNMPEEKIYDDDDKRITLDINAFVGDENDKNLWLYDCVFKLSSQSKEYLRKCCEADLLGLSKDGDTIGGNDMEGKKIFIIHGHDHGLRDKVELLLSKAKINYEILEYAPTEGAEMIIEKLERVCSSCTHAVALLTKDDLTHDGEPRARQNVLFEIGYFCGIRNRRSVILINLGVEIPSDLAGVMFISPKSVEDADWKLQLVRNLRALGFDGFLDGVF